MKAIKSFTHEGNIKFFGTDNDVMIPDTYHEKDIETRGVWFSTVENIDIPKIESVEQYKEYLLDVIKTVKSYHMNTVIFQVRPANDAFYPTKLAPWSKYITGTQGKDPGFDVFGFFVEEAKKEGIATHAWINPYRISGDKLDELKLTKEEYVETLAKTNFARLHPECVIETSLHKLILDPANETVREYISDVVYEIAEKYDIKAVHIDDYFYPYEPIADNDEEYKFKQSGFAKLGDFRRNNVDKCIALIHQKLQKLPKKVEFGISPFGVFRTNTKFYKEPDEEASWEYGSNNHQACLTCYKGLYADVIKWMEEGWIDYVTPQVYYDFENIIINKEGKEMCLVQYADIVKWWAEISKKIGTKVYIGQAMYLYGGKGPGWGNPEEIPNQLLYNQLFDNIQGTVFFTYKNFVDTKNEVMVKGQQRLKAIWTKDTKEI